MSFNGLLIFEKNLETLMKTKVFKESDDNKKIELGLLLLNSKYGTKNISKPKELKL